MSHRSPTNWFLIFSSDTLSGSSTTLLGVPQGSVLGPIFCSPLGGICQKHDVLFHEYAYDTENYLSFKPAVPALSAGYSFMDLLQLNDSMTAYIMFGTRQLAKIIDRDIFVGDEKIQNSSFVCNLGFCSDD